jgi:hypothetical protein
MVYGGRSGKGYRVGVGGFFAWEGNDPITARPAGGGQETGRSL